jgi:hypothetical protein
MPKPFRPLTISEFTREVHSFPWQRRVWRIDVHHSVVPSIANYEGLASIEGIWQRDLEYRHFEDIAQHVSIAPDGTIWTGRDWNRTPASIGRHMNLGAFMIELIGNFDNGRDILRGPQLMALIEAIDCVQIQFALPVQALLFHRDVPQAECSSPGSGIVKADILKSVRALRSGEVGASGATFH